MRKVLSIFLIGFSFLMISFCTISENAEASVKKSQVIVRFYQDKDDGSIDSKETPDNSSDNKLSLPKTGSAKSYLGIIIGMVLLISIGWLNKDSQNN
ncbi:LPXTG cell wall anchor domain-containing protein [Enterococcus mundtii]|uniref:Gram-positive cocci surface proteins LPxTG domain-containing protein n=1 Tax=Enterococcus mundtii TaxID=53346 RepID=A0A242KFJ3_ENTMU|nr:LPXTG cell wall anchor domain-containing protein [Enterococcus mundtii]OTP19935.1 hypothetical protein A5802_003339 [Enterococcus mundtii]